MQTKIANIRVIFGALLLLLTLVTPINAGDNSANNSPTVEVNVFDQNVIHFFPDSLSKFATDKVTSLDNGRVISSTVDLPDFDSPVKIIAHVALHPIPKDPRVVHDTWDRAGNVRLSVEGRPDIEIIKFITSYGGFTEHKMDVSHLAPLLKGSCQFKGFVDTWVSPAWKMDFSLSFEAYDGAENPDWNRALIYTESFDHKNMADRGVETEIEIPESIGRILLYYFVSGHCTDGRDADEFVTKDNVIYVDGGAVYRCRPWRDDCRQFRADNPYCAKWSDGWWSSDFSRSGWCPGDMVEPLVIDLTDHLAPGKHKLRFLIENIRPEDENGHYGYWRVSSHLGGYIEKR